MTVWVEAAFAAQLPRKMATYKVFVNEPYTNTSQRPPGTKCDMRTESRHGRAHSNYLVHIFLLKFKSLLLFIAAHVFSIFWYKKESVLI